MKGITLDSARIEEIQKATAYPDSTSVQQALLQVKNECEQLVRLQDAEDGVWVHCHAGGQYFSINLAHDTIARKFCLAYHESLQPKG